MSNNYPEYLTTETLDEPHNRIIAFVRAYRATHEYGPSNLDISHGVGMTVGTARTMVERLIRSGYLRRPDDKARTLREAKGEERAGALLEGWLAKIRELPREEQAAALEAAAKVRADKIKAAGAEVGP